MLVHRGLTPIYPFNGYPFIHLGGDRQESKRVKYLAQEHNAVPRPGLEPGPFDLESDLESNALTELPTIIIPNYTIPVAH